jgi:hypothetical protein
MIRIRGAVYAICVVILSALPGRTAAIPLVTVRLAPEIHSEDLNISYVLSERQEPASQPERTFTHTRSGQFTMARSQPASKL